MEANLTEETLTYAEIRAFIELKIFSKAPGAAGVLAGYLKFL